MNSPDIQIAFRCDVCHECVIENVFTMNRREREYDAPVCRECAEQAEAAVIGLMVDSVTRPDPVADPYTRTRTPIPAMCRCSYDYREEYRPPVHRSNNWLGLFIAVVLVIAAAVALGRCVT